MMKPFRLPTPAECLAMISRRQAESPARSAPPLTRAERELAEAERVLVNITLEMDLVVISGDDPSGILARHTEQCQIVRNLRRELERMQYSDR